MRKGLHRERFSKSRFRQSSPNRKTSHECDPFRPVLRSRCVPPAGIRLDRIRFIRPDVAQVKGLASRDESPRESQFRALLARKGGRWLIDNVTESLLPRAAGTYDRLRELEFLVGDWVDDRADARTATTGRWSANRSFLVRSYTFQRGDGSTHEGTQIIGWGVS